MAFFAGGCLHVSDTRSNWVKCAETSNHHDGDTFTCKPASGFASQFAVRVASIDTPETGQAYWRLARVRLRELATRGSSVDCYKVDRYERRVCRLKTSDGQDSADLMLSEGLAWYPEDYSPEDAPADRERYRRLQSEAQAAKRGLWAEPDSMPPKTCRQRRQAWQTCH
ncbi:thermonuclease family protein [Roseateles cavernae]|uniref:thermonuclease family protein n=1 Tax=Roseateles cavernae TaxID=3153578 RepID=UPI003D80E452